jgi:transcriptional regulator with XRE-family HTH domain
MTSSSNADSGEGFARAFGNRLRNYLAEQGMTQVDAAKALGLTDKKSGKPSKSRLNKYLNDSPSMPEAQILYLACTKLNGFNFEYNGYRINAETVRRKGAATSETQAEQMTFRFNRQFSLTARNGAITEVGAFAVKVKRPPGRIEFSVSLRANRSSQKALNSRL